MRPTRSPNAISKRLGLGIGSMMHANNSPRQTRSRSHDRPPPPRGDRSAFPSSGASKNWGNSPTCRSCGISPRFTANQGIDISSKTPSIGVLRHSWAGSKRTFSLKTFFAGSSSISTSGSLCRISRRISSSLSRDLATIVNQRLTESSRW